MSGNLYFDIRSKGRFALDCAVKIAFRAPSGEKATHYYEREKDGQKTLILLWHEERDAIKLPFPLTEDRAVDFILGWLDNVPWPKEPDHDGSNAKGFRIFVDKWGRVDGWDYSFVGVECYWMIYGK